jgi:uncharacterized protein (UPF0548 family)
MQLQRPAANDLAAFLQRQQGKPFSYPEVGATAGQFPAGYDHDRQRVLLGSGEQVFAAAEGALRQWRQFPAPWTVIEPAAGPLAAGSEVVLLVRVLGLWWVCGARIVYTIDERGPVGRGSPDPAPAGDLRSPLRRGRETCAEHEIDERGPPRRFGFAYGTLESHVERGEERFLVEMDETGQVWYELAAFSRPRHPLVRLAYPLARRYQAKFRRESAAAMQQSVQTAAAEQIACRS